MRLRLDTLEKTRLTYARLLRLRATGRLNPPTFRDLVYGFTSFLGYWKLEADIRLEEKLEALERKLDGGAG